MGLTAGLLRGLGRLPEQRSGLQYPESWLTAAWGADGSYAGKSVTAEASLGLIPVWACVRLLSGTIGSLPLVVYESSDDGRRRERARTSNEWRILHDEPNPEMAADQLWELVIGHLNLWGNAYLEKVPFQGSDGALAKELWPLSPSKVHVERDERTKEKRFRVDGSTSTYGEDTILHIPGFGYDGLRGLSPIGQARQELGTALAMQEYLGRFVSNNATPAGVIQLPEGQDLEDESARIALRSEWEALYGGLSNAGRVAVLENGASWQALGMPLKDVEFVALQRFGLNTIARLFQVPPEMVGGDRDSSMTYSTVEGWALNFVTYSLRRWFVRIEKALRRDRMIFPDRKRYPEFLAEALLRGDSQARANFYKIMAEIESLTINEVRERENLEPLPDGDRAPIVAGKAPAAAPAVEDGATGRRNLEQTLERLMERERPVVNVPAPEVRFEEGAFKVDVAPPEVRFEEGAIRGGDVTVEAPPPQPAPNLTIHLPGGGKRTIAFSDGREATITEETPE